MRSAILGSLKEIAQKAKEKIGDFEKENPFGHFMIEYDGDEVQEVPHLQARRVSFNEVETSAGKGKRKANIGMNACFKDGRDSSQPTIKAFNSPFYQNAIDYIVATGHGYKGPSYHAIKGSSFIKSVDASDIKTNAQNLCNLFAEIFEIVGPRTNHQKKSYDPIDYESIDKTEFWVVEEEPNGELDYDELEAELEELPIDDIVECSNSQKAGDDEDDDKIGEDVDLELFQCRGFGLTDKDDEWLN
ncbi:hypothetical protein ACH5RR_037208 [Cinchona calisaya]|uniref:Transposase n=1 Tax=Cinchona calisaya TaxID=153742 RepID=A0ABD2Y9U2_9GENT